MSADWYMTPDKILVGLLVFGAILTVYPHAARTQHPALYLALVVTLVHAVGHVVVPLALAKLA